MVEVSRRGPRRRRGEAGSQISPSRLAVVHWAIRELDLFDGIDLDLFRL
jgi:hypothetical protein